MKLANVIFLFFVLMLLPPIGAQASDDSVANQTATDKVDAGASSCADVDAARLLVNPSEPIAYEMIENNPIGATATFRVRLLETGVRDGKLRLHSIAYPDAVANIAFATSVDLKEGEDAVVTIKAEDILWPGVRTATICLTTQFRFKDQEKDKIFGEVLVQKSVDVTFDVRTLPRIASLQEKIDLAVVKCSWDWSCSLATAISPGLAATTEDWILGFRNDSLATVNGAPLLQMRRAGEPNQNRVIELQGKQELAIGEIGWYTLKLDPTMGPGKLEGEIVFRAHPSGEKPLPGRKDDKGITRNVTETTVAANISVRVGIAVPLLLLLLGIIAGRMNRQLSKPETQTRLKLVDRMYGVSAKIELLRHLSSKIFMRRRIIKIQRDLSETTIDNESITEELSQIESQTYMFQLIEDLTHHDASGSVTPIAAEAREFIRQGEFTKAEEKRIEIVNKLQELEVMSGGQAELLKPQAMVDADKAAAIGGGATVNRTFADRVAGFIAWIAGTRAASTKTLYRYIQPFATILLLIALVALGLFTFYGGPEHNTFGESLIGDYLPLFLWGFGTDVLSKRLTDITISK